MIIWLYVLASVLIVSVVSLIGVFTLSFNTEKLNRVLILLVSFAAGALIGDAFLHLLPELAEEAGGMPVSMSLGVIGGIIIFFILEKFIHWHHCHKADANGSHTHSFAITNLIGDAAHNFLDGVIIGAAYLVSIHIGIATTIAVALHEIPQEIGDFGVLLHGGFTKKQALVTNFIVALFAVLGAVLALTIGETVESAVEWIVPLAAGSFIYIAAADLIPELHRETRPSRSAWQLITFIFGVAAMSALLLLD